MRNPRITGYNQDVYKVNLDDGSSIKCTGNHKFILSDGIVKEAL
jgi:intein/homing endonuclease